MPRVASVFQPDPGGLNQRFSKQFRLRTKADFGAMQRGKRLNCENIRLVYRDNQLAMSRLGLAVSKKYGNAVRRNRLKRRLREAFRVSAIRSLGVDVLAIPRAAACGENHVVHDFVEALAMIRSRKGLRR